MAYKYTYKAQGVLETLKSILLSLNLVSLSVTRKNTLGFFVCLTKD
jgi:hypothetical protein